MKKNSLQLVFYYTFAYFFNVYLLVYFINIIYI